MFSLVKGTFKFIAKPRSRFLFLAEHGLLKSMSDESFIKRLFKLSFGYELDLDNPITFSEKLQWLKLNDRNPMYTLLVDKHEVKEIVSRKIGRGHVIPTYGVWNSFDDIDFASLPDQFVLKCTHDSGGIVICEDKKKMDMAIAKRKINSRMRHNYYDLNREWPYKDVPHRIIAEKLMVDDTGDELRDYKVLCFNGEPKLIELHSGRYKGHHTQDFYDTKWNKTSISQGGSSYFKGDGVAPKPDTLDEMLELSSVLSKDIAQVRVDWYSVHGKLYFGEITLYDGSGIVPFDNPDDDLMLGSWISLPEPFVAACKS